jgi:hypothetical protein|tara:strand:+ start:1860 stop:2129 length:270 start_codon:yes stop_codon:yes gene_type:complete
MQKVINVIALLSGLTSLGMIAGSAYLYVQKDVMIRELTNNLVEGAVGAIADAVPDILDASIPELPTATGGPVPGVPPRVTVTKEVKVLP